MPEVLVTKLTIGRIDLGPTEPRQVSPTKQRALDATLRPFRGGTAADCRRCHAAGLTEGYRRALGMAKGLTREDLIVWLERRIRGRTV
jgi:hypothetical protein